jgi:hypothetical protein
MSTNEQLISSARKCTCTGPLVVKKYLAKDHVTALKHLDLSPPASTEKVTARDTRVLTEVWPLWSSG